ncbi:MAG: hypothetical protein NTV25_08365 [Methanothrix sp.]|nr:hypothetical protein [Methanothrix sp.]
MMALALLIASFSIIVAQTTPWEGSDGRALPGISALPDSGYTPLAVSSWQPSLAERILLFGLGAIISCALLACIRHRRKEKNNSNADWE